MSDEDVVAARLSGEASSELHHSAAWGDLRADKEDALRLSRDRAGGGMSTNSSQSFPRTRSPPLRLVQWRGR